MSFTVINNNNINVINPPTGASNSNIASSNAIRFRGDSRKNVEEKFIATSKAIEAKDKEINNGVSIDQNNGLIVFAENAKFTVINYDNSNGYTGGTNSSHPIKVGKKVLDKIIKNARNVLEAVKSSLQKQEKELSSEDKSVNAEENSNEDIGLSSEVQFAPIDDDWEIGVLENTNNSSQVEKSDLGESSFVKEAEKDNPTESSSDLVHLESDDTVDFSDDSKGNMFEVYLADDLKTNEDGTVVLDESDEKTNSIMDFDFVPDDNKEIYNKEDYDTFSVPSHPAKLNVINDFDYNTDNNKNIDDKNFKSEDEEIQIIPVREADGSEQVNGAVSEENSHENESSSTESEEVTDSDQLDFNSLMDQKQTADEALNIAQVENDKANENLEKTKETERELDKRLAVLLKQAVTVVQERNAAAKKLNENTVEINNEQARLEVAISDKEEQLRALESFVAENSNSSGGFSK